MQPPPGCSWEPQLSSWLTRLSTSIWQDYVVYYWAGAFFAADQVVNRARGKDRKRSRGQQEDGSGTAITIGALMDGIPESVAIGVSLIGGGSVSWAMVAAVFLSNAPEGLSAAAG